MVTVVNNNNNNNRTRQEMLTELDKPTDLRVYTIAQARRGIPADKKKNCINFFFLTVSFASLARFFCSFGGFGGGGGGGQRAPFVRGVTFLILSLVCGGYRTCRSFVRFFFVFPGVIERFVCVFFVDRAGACGGIDDG